MAEPTATTADGATHRVDAFVRRFGLWHRVATVCAIGFAEAIVVFAAVWVVHEFSPKWEAMATWAGVALWCGAVGHAWWRASVSVAAMDRSLGLRDALRTWCDGPARGPMRDWLARVVANRIQGVQRGAMWRPVRRRLRPLRILVPVAVALLILRLLDPDEPKSGPFPVAVPDLVTVPGGGTAVVDSSRGGSGEGESDRPDSNPDSASDDADTDPDADPGPADDGPVVEGAPLIERSVEDDFVIPSFVGDGPSSRTESHVARVGDDSVEEAPRNGDAESIPTPVVPDVEFEHAVERALAGRHVGPAERELVRRYFRLLVERRR
ncbi:MAG: hypothetical protein KDB80_08985 [Planctomycetes bacterium]|nr:hypothetical protein [Planctomycetota bacterium]